MSAQQFLMDQIGRAKRVIEGLDYMHDSTQTQSKAQRGSSKLKRTVTHQSGQVRTTPAVPNPQNPNASAASRARTPISKPNPYAAKPTGSLTGSTGNGNGLRRNGGGLVGALVTGAQIGTQMRDTMPQSTFVSGRGGGSRATNNPRKNTPDPTNPVRPSQPGGERTVFAGQESTADRIKRRESVGLRNHREGGGNQNRSGLTPIDGSYRKTVEAGPDGKVTPGSLPASINTVWKVEDSTLNNGRDNSRTNPNGVVQKGTDMSRSFNDLLATTNTSGYQPFSSNQLPTSAASPDAVLTPKTQQILAGIQAGKETDMSIDGYQAPTSSAKAGVLGGIRGGARTDRGIQGTSTAADGVFAGIQAGQKTDQGIEGYKKPGSTSRLDAALNDKAGMQSYMSKFSSGDRERAANRAFLDTEDSMLALRAKEAVNGVVYANQQHYVAGSDADGPAQKISRDQARDISNGKSSAQSLLAAHIDKNKNAETPAEAQEPFTLEKPGVKQSFGRSETITPGIDTSIPDTTAFNINNGVDVPGFGNTGGYKPTTKKPAVDYSSIYS